MLEDILRILLQALVVINLLFAIVIVFFEKHSPASTWAWLMVLVVIPYGGAVLYLLLGLDARKYRNFAFKRKQDELVAEEYLRLDGAIAQQRLTLTALMHQRQILSHPGTEHLNDLAYLNYFAGDGGYSTNNRVLAFYEGAEKFEFMLRDIAGAKKFIHMEYYILRDDHLGREVIAALAEKAAQGLEVRLLIDGVGNVFNSRKLYQPLLDAGGYLGVFMRPHFVRMNFRNHRKICVVDGAVGYVGGLNIGDEYVGMSKKFGPWRDTHIRLSGDAVRQMELRFIMDWNFYSRDKIALSLRYFPQLPEHDNATPAQIVCSGPDTRYPSILQGYTKMIAEANKTVYIQTPYFVPDDSLFETVRLSALSGVDVRIMIPAYRDHPFVHWASLSYLGELLAAGVKCYQYEKGFLHAKMVVVDGMVSSVGTTNMDVRSFRLNFEINAFLYDGKLAREFEKAFLRDLEDCTPIQLDWYLRRSRWTKVRESVSRLLSPLL